MIIDNTYFTGKIYIPYAKPGIMDSVNIDSAIIDFINEYVEDCLIKCLGPLLYEDLLLNLDANESTWVDASSDSKWDELVNGKTYINSNGDTVKWKGIRYKTGLEQDKHKSFLANYVYFYYEKKEFITRSNIGHEKEVAKNADNVTPMHKVVTAWNEFVNLVQGDNDYRNVHLKESHGYGVDFYKGSSSISLYQFIKDSNKINEGTYANFQPKNWDRMNQFNL